MAQSSTVPPPVGGWDTRNTLADMPIINAVVLDNWFPGTDSCSVRRGSADHATGLGASVDSLMRYVPNTGAEELFGVAGGSIYDVTSSGAVGAAVVSGLSNSRFQHTQFGNAAGNYLLAVNGADTPRQYDGSTWGTMSITPGPTVANLIWINSHKDRLWVGEEDSLDAWYFASQAISGPPTKFPLGGIAKLGGFIMAMGTWSRDAGDGPDDFAVFLTSEGEAIIYQGTDPTSASTWGLVGVFRIGKPIGRRCIVKYGADLVIITEDGFVSAERMFTVDRAEKDRAEISQQINSAVNTAVRAGKNLFGWEPFIYPQGTMMVFNVPISSSEVHQYVFNTITGAPTRFKGWNAQCWALLEEDPYFGTSDGRVVKADTGSDDGDSPIESDALQAFNYFGMPGNIKHVTMAEPVFNTEGAPLPSLKLNVDYSTSEASAPVNVTLPAAGAVWGTAVWGVDVWGRGQMVEREWSDLGGIGRAISLRMRMSSKVTTLQWLATNYIYEPGGLVG